LLLPPRGLEQTAKSPEKLASRPERGAKSGALESTGAQKLDVNALAQALRDLSPADWERLTRILGQGEGNTADHRG
jgi:hypothetical protein